MQHALIIHTSAWLPDAAPDPGRSPAPGSPDTSISPRGAAFNTSRRRGALLYPGRPPVDVAHCSFPGNKQLVWWLSNIPGSNQPARLTATYRTTTDRCGSRQHLGQPPVCTAPAPDGSTVRDNARGSHHMAIVPPRTLWPPLRDQRPGCGFQYLAPARSSAVSRTATGRCGSLQFPGQQSVGAGHDSFPGNKQLVWWLSNIPGSNQPVRIPATYRTATGRCGSLLFPEQQSAGADSCNLPGGHWSMRVTTASRTATSLYSPRSRWLRCQG